MDGWWYEKERKKKWGTSCQDAQKGADTVMGKSECLIGIVMPTSCSLVNVGVDATTAGDIVAGRRNKRRRLVSYVQKVRQACLRGQDQISIE